MRGSKWLQFIRDWSNDCFLLEVNQALPSRYNHLPNDFGDDQDCGATQFPLDEIRDANAKRHFGALPAAPNAVKMVEPSK